MTDKRLKWTEPCRCRRDSLDGHRHIQPASAGMAMSRQIQRNDPKATGAEFGDDGPHEFGSRPPAVHDKYHAAIGLCCGLKVEGHRRTSPQGELLTSGLRHEACC